MKREKMVADELQCMFLEGKLQGFKEEYKKPLPENYGLENCH